MKPEHIVKLKGKEFVTYGGLLDLAHERGLNVIDTELIQAPTDENGHTAICKAIVRMDGGRSFSGIGDANPQNVGKAIVPHLTRMAETRSKARALRDALNVDATALEELGGEEPQTPAPKPSEGNVTPLAPIGAKGEPGTGKQKWKIRKLLEEKKMDEANFEKKHGSINQMDKGTCSTWIETLENA